MKRKASQLCRDTSMAKLTTKQRRLIKGIAGGMTQRAAANAAGISEEYASRVVKKGQVLEALGELMERSGLGDMTLLTKHAELLEATKVIAVVVGKKVAGGSVDLIVPDYAVQAKALDRAYRLRGFYQKQAEHCGLTSVPVDFRVTFVDPKGQPAPEAGPDMEEV